MCEHHHGGHGGHGERPREGCCERKGHDEETANLLEQAYWQALREILVENVKAKLKKTAGKDLDRFAARYGVDLEAVNAPRLERLERAGKIVLTGRRLEPTIAGLAIADALMRELGVGEPRAAAGGEGR